MEESIQMPPGTFVTIGAQFESEKHPANESQTPRIVVRVINNSGETVYSYVGYQLDSPTFTVTLRTSRQLFKDILIKKARQYAYKHDLRVGAVLRPQLTSAVDGLFDVISRQESQRLAALRT